MALDEDDRARARALEPAGSFIVQAPAGSGKTGLLTQRYLRLLACVDAPEEIVAITFTRKAAAEMRERILGALAAAEDETPPASAHVRLTWQLARAARARDAERDWRIMLHPARLRIQTLDSLNAELTRQMPILSGFGAQPGIAERAAELYREAAQRTLALLDQGDATQATAVATLLAHLDNDVPRATRMLADMLMRRDQWLRHLGGGVAAAEAADRQRVRQGLELAFRREIEAQLESVQQHLPEHLHEEIVSLAAYAGRMLWEQDVASPLRQCADLQALPAANVEALPQWQGLVELLLTAQGTWRVRVDKNLGFPRDSDEKPRMAELLATLSNEEALRKQLVRLRLLPAPVFTQPQWQALEALLSVLPLGTAQLKLLFAEQGKVDFMEVALRALDALGTPEVPTDLALALDQRIRHLLVDEFQDTSRAQFELLERLTAGWQPGDGRSLFLVGDPMQSIYRFREAEVGLFLRTREQGIGQLRPESLVLQRNFRSQAGIVDWVNATFSQIFPDHDAVTNGAIAYRACVACADLPARPQAVTVHPAFIRDPAAEAAQMVSLIQAARANAHTVAVLTRSRAHLVALMPALRHAGVRFRAVELEALGQRPVVQDLLALTRALLHPGDRTAWLALLRAPWCGLSLADLHALVRDSDRPLATLLNDSARIASLSPEGQARLVHTRDVLLDALAQTRRGSLREQVERTWLKLAGPATLGTPAELDEAEAFLALLEQHNQGGAWQDLTVLESALDELYAPPDPDADDSVQLMTMHKAKGLEFDVVLVPGLGYKTQSNRRQLLIYLERYRDTPVPDLLLAPLNARGSDKDPLYELVRATSMEQEDYERQRLMYVAATRARQALHLFGQVRCVEGEGEREMRPPPASSLLATLWPAVESDFRAALGTHTALQDQATEPVAAVSQYLRGLPVDWQPPEPAADSLAPYREDAVSTEQMKREFEWVGDSLRIIGTVVHRLLQRIASDDNPELWQTTGLKQAEDWLCALLRQGGLPASELEQALATVQAAARRMLEDETGRLILMARGPEAHCEYALSMLEHGRLVTGVMDRCFVDNDGMRWIVDYKTSRHEGAGLEQFLENEADRYRDQLVRYARLMSQYEQRPLKLGLYFPLLGRFHEVNVAIPETA